MLLKVRVECGVTEACRGFVAEDLRDFGLLAPFEAHLDIAEVLTLSVVGAKELKLGLKIYRTVLSFLLEQDARLALEVFGQRRVALLERQITLNSLLCSMVGISDILDELSFEGSEAGVDNGLTSRRAEQRIVKLLHLIEANGDREIVCLSLRAQVVACA